MDYSIADRPTGFLFTAEGDGTAPLQLQFLAEAEEFVYLRKGEWGVGEVVTYIVAWLDSGGWEVVRAGTVDSEALLRWAESDVAKQILVGVGIATALVAGIVTSLEIIITRVALVYKATREWLKARSAKRPSTTARDRWVICTRRPKESTLAFCKVAGIQVRQNQGADSQSRHRYYVNEKHFCLFLDLGERKYLGWYGDDAKVIKVLKADFEREWKSNGEQAVLI